MRAAIAADSANKAAQRDLSFLGYTRGRALVGAGRPAQARPHLQSLLNTLPEPAPGAVTDFYLARVRGDTQVWLARAWLGSDPARALALARAAQPAMQADDDNAARRWMLALAQGEEAAALHALGQQSAAAAAAGSALASWRVGVGVPGQFVAWLQRDEALAR